MEKLDLKKYNLVSLDEKEIKNKNGGFLFALNPWGWMLVGYVVSEVANGIQAGLQGECD